MTLSKRRSSGCPHAETHGGIVQALLVGGSRARLHRRAVTGAFCIALAWSLIPWAGPGGFAMAHPGELDRYGGHFSDKTEVYHYHRPKADMVRRKREFLTWVKPGETGELRGKIVGIDRPDAVWMQVPYRPAYQDLVNLVTASDRDDKNQRVRVWFRFVSPEASVDSGRKYNAWFRKKVIYELDTKLMGKAVTVQFKVAPTGGRMKGMILLGEENVNLWLVLNGWSYLMVSDGENPHEELFLAAEANARKVHAGLWERSK